MSLPLQPGLLDLVQEGLVTDLEPLCSLLSVPAGLLQDGSDDLAFRPANGLLAERLEGIPVQVLLDQRIQARLLADNGKAVEG